MGSFYFNANLINPNLFSTRELVEKCLIDPSFLKRIPDPEYRRIKEIVDRINTKYSQDFKLT